MIYDVPLEASLDHVATWCVFYPFGPMQWDGQFIVTPFSLSHVAFVVRPWSRACIIRTWGQYFIELSSQSWHPDMLPMLVFDTKNESKFTKQVPRNTQLCLMNGGDHQNIPKLWSLVPVCLPRCWRILNHVPQSHDVQKRIERVWISNAC